ncbi:MAG: CoA transferase [Chloroflexi bacterium]|nr:CoA transferase [Chloroflexota bacterium]
MPAALDGLRVIDLTQGVAGPYATNLFAGLGADVIKVEPPGAGDFSRRLRPFPEDRPDGEGSGLFHYLNAGKKSVTLDTAGRSGQALLHKLAATSDIVIEEASTAGGGSPLDYETIQAVKPEVIVTSVTSFGGDGPYHDFAGSEIVYQALCGLAFMTGEPSREPLMVGVPLAQYAAGQLACVATLTAFYHRLESGEGQRVDVSVFEAATTIMEHAPAIWSYRRIVRKRMGNLGGLAGWGIYPCRDGYVGVISGLGQTYDSFLDWLGLTDPKFRSWAARTVHADEMHAAIVGWLADRSRHDVFREAQARGFPFGYVCTVEDLAQSPQLEARGFFQAVEHPRLGRLTVPGAPFLMSGTPWRTERAPRLGEHNEAVFCGELGVSRQELARLAAAGVV